MNMCKSYKWERYLAAYSVSTDIRPSRASSEYLRLFPWLSNFVLDATPLSEAIPHDHPLFVRGSFLKPV